MPSPIELPAPLYQRLAECACRAGCADLAELLNRLCEDSDLLDMVAARLHVAPPVTSGIETAVAPIRPSCNIFTKTAVRIFIEGTAVIINFPEYPEQFKKLVKSYHFEWLKNRLHRWGRETGNDESALHCAAEIGHRLVMAGFVVMPPSTAVAQMILNETYIRERRRWVLVSARAGSAGWFSLTWPWEDDLYTEARLVSGSFYDPDNHCVIVPPEQYEEVADFAQTNQFSWSDEAIAVYNEAKRAVYRTLLLTEPTTDFVPPPPSDGRTQGVLDELKDPSF